MGELRLRARARPEAQIAQDADLELLGQVGLGEGWSRLSPLIAHAQVEHLGPRRRGAVLGIAHATGRAVVGTARSSAAAQHDAGGSLAHEREELARRGRFFELRREILDRDGAQLVSRHAAEQPAKERGAVLGGACVNVLEDAAVADGERRRMAAAAVWRVMLHLRALVWHRAPSTASHSVEERRRASVRYEEDGMARGWPRERCCRRRAHCDVVAAMAAPAAPELVLRPVLEVHSARWRARRGSSETGSAPMYLDRRSPALSHAIKGAPLSALRIRHTTLLSGGEGAGDGGGEGGGGGAGGGVPRKCKHGRRPSAPLTRSGSRYLSRSCELGIKSERLMESH